MRRRHVLIVCAGLAGLAGLLTWLLAGCADAGSADRAGADRGRDGGHGGDGNGGDGARPGPGPSSREVAYAFRELERRFGARLGVYALDTGTGRSVAYRAGQRFAYCSTLKALTAGLVLRGFTDGQLDRVVRYDRSDVLEWAPVTSRHVSTGMRLRDLLDAALRYSDNTAANLVMEQLGGPRQVGSALRELGDHTTHVDRTEPTLNEARPGDVRDTSTPRALADDLRQFLLGDRLSGQRRALLADWMGRNTTGGPYMRAGVPSGWTVQDKTGNGRYGTRNDIAVVRPPGGGAPIVLAVLSRRTGEKAEAAEDAEDAASDDALIAEATAKTLATLR